MKNLLFIFGLIPISIFAQSTIYTFEVYSGLRSKTDVYIQKGDTLRISAKGIITLGAFAGRTSPEGLPSGSFSAYNAVRGAPHGALLCKIGEGRVWELVGKSVEIIAKQEGYLHLMVNDTDPSNNYGFFSTRVEASKMIDKIIIGKIGDEELWVYRNFSDDRKIYFREMIFKQEFDNRWYIKGKPNGGVIQVVEIKDQKLRFISDAKELEAVLHHINRNRLNKEAKGKLNYLCSMDLDVSLLTDLAGYKQNCDNFLYHFYTDENNCIWTLALECESIFHKNPDNETETGFKFTRIAAKDFQKTNLSYESVRIPRTGEKPGSPQIVGKTFQLKDDHGKLHSSPNLRHSVYRGTYNYGHSIFASQSLMKYLEHNKLDMKPHNNWQHYTLFFPEKYDLPSKREIDLINKTRKLPIIDGQRTCALENFPWK